MGHDSIQDAAVALELALVLVQSRLEGTSDDFNKTTIQTPWAGADSFLHPKAPLLQLADVDGALTGSLHAYTCGPYSDRSQQERFLIGYRRESSVLETLRLHGCSESERPQSDTVSSKLALTSHMYASQSEAVSAAYAHTLSHELSGSVVWLDYNLTRSQTAVRESYEAEGRAEDDVKGELLDLFDLDVVCERLYASAPPNTLILVATQGVRSMHMYIYTHRRIYVLQVCHLLFGINTFAPLAGPAAAVYQGVKEAEV